MPAELTFRDGTLTPPVIMVPATFRIDLRIRFADGGVHGVAVGPIGDRVGYRGGFSELLPGLRKGRSLVVRVDGARARIVSGLQPGP